MTQSQHIQKSPKKIWATFPMLNFSRWTPTLGASLKWNDQKRPKLAHFGIFRHIGGVGGVQKNVDLKIQWVKGNCSKNCGYWASWGPTIIFSEKNLERSNYCTPRRKQMLLLNLKNVYHDLVWTHENPPPQARRRYGRLLHTPCSLTGNNWDWFL